MTKFKIINSEKAPKAIGPYSHAVLSSAKFRLELSGQLGIDAATGTLALGVQAQAEQALKNIGHILEEIGWDFSHIVKSRIFLADMADYKAVNDIYAVRFAENPPARVALAAKGLPLGALVEIECAAEGDNIRHTPNER